MNTSTANRTSVKPKYPTRIENPNADHHLFVVKLEEHLKTLTELGMWETINEIYANPGIKATARHRDQVSSFMTNYHGKGCVIRRGNNRNHMQYQWNPNLAEGKIVRRSEYNPLKSIQVEVEQLSTPQAEEKILPTPEYYLQQMAQLQASYRASVLHAISLLEPLKVEYNGAVVMISRNKETGAIETSVVEDTLKL